MNRIAFRPAPDCAPARRRRRLGRRTPAPLSLADALARGRAGARETVAASGAPARRRGQGQAGRRLPAAAGPGLRAVDPHRLPRRRVRPAAQPGALLVPGLRQPATRTTPDAARDRDHPARGRGADLDRRRDLDPGRAGPPRRRGGRRERAPAPGDQAAVAAAEAWIRLAQAREAVALLEKSRETVAAHVELARATTPRRA